VLLRLDLGWSVGTVIEMFGVRLTVVGDAMEAAAICGLLRTEGIACDDRRTDMGAGAWEATGTGGPREILVAASDLERARELIEPAIS
jgi:Putative prokaryotic signal transducing protein